LLWHKNLPASLVSSDHSLEPSIELADRIPDGLQVQFKLRPSLLVVRCLIADRLRNTSPELLDAGSHVFKVFHDSVRSRSTKRLQGLRQGLSLLLAPCQGLVRLSIQNPRHGLYFALIDESDHGIVPKKYEN